MFIPFFRFSQALTGPLTSLATTIPADLSAIVLPNTGDYTRVVISSGTVFEVVKLARNGAAVVVTRGQEGTLAQGFPAGAAIAYENTPQNILDTERPCEDRYVPIAPVADGIYQNATVRVVNGVITQVQGGTNVIVSQCDECDEPASGSGSFAPTNTIAPVAVGALQGFDVRISGQAGNLLAQDGNGARVILSYQNSDTVAWSGNGLAASPLVNNVRISTATGNSLSKNSDGLFVSVPAPNGAQKIMESDDIRIVGGPSGAQLLLKPTGVSPDGSDKDVGGLVFDEDGRLRTVPPDFNPPRSITSATPFITADTAASGVATLTYNGTIVPLAGNTTISVSTTGTERSVSLNAGAVVVAAGNTRATVARNATTGVLTLDAPGRTIINTDGSFLVDLATNPNEARLSAGPRTLNGRSIYFNSSTSWSSNGITSNGSTHTIEGANFATQRWDVWARNEFGIPLAVVRIANSGNFLLAPITANTTTGVLQFGSARSATAGDWVLAVLLP